MIVTSGAQPISSDTTRYQLVKTESQTYYSITHGVHQVLLTKEEIESLYQLTKEK